MTRHLKLAWCPKHGARYVAAWSSTCGYTSHEPAGVVTCREYLQAQAPKPASTPPPVSPDFPHFVPSVSPC